MTAPPLFNVTIPTAVHLFAGRAYSESAAPLLSSSGDRTQQTAADIPPPSSSPPSDRDETTDREPTPNTSTKRSAAVSSENIAAFNWPSLITALTDTFLPADHRSLRQTSPPLDTQFTYATANTATSASSAAASSGNAITTATAAASSSSSSSSSSATSTSSSSSSLVNPLTLRVSSSSSSASSTALTAPKSSADVQTSAAAAFTSSGSSSASSSTSASATSTSSSSSSSALSAPSSSVSSFSSSSVDAVELCPTCITDSRQLCVLRWRQCILLLVALSVVSLAQTVAALAAADAAIAALHLSECVVLCSALLSIRTLRPAAAAYLIPQIAAFLPLIVFLYTAYVTAIRPSPSAALLGAITTVGCAVSMSGVFGGLIWYAVGVALITTMHWHERTLTHNMIVYSVSSLLLISAEYWRHESVRMASALLSQHRADRDEARSASKLKSEFLASTSHDLRNPMHSIMAMLELTIRDSTLNEEQRECLSTAYSSAEDLLGLLNDLLDISRIEAGRLQLESIPLDLNAVMEKAVKMFASNAAKKNVEMIYDCDPSITYITSRLSGDPSRLSQIVNNLLSNAVKFTNRGEIHVKLSLLPPTSHNVTHVHLMVRDTGEGISPDAIPHLFEPFRQGDGSVNRRHGGSGLGLYCASELVKAMKGSIWCTSQLGVGSQFHVALQFQTRADDAGDEDKLHFYQRRAVSPSNKINSPTHLSSAFSEPLVPRRINVRPTDVISDHPRPPLRVLLAVNNAINRDVLRRQIQWWTETEHRRCSVDSMCAVCGVGSSPDVPVHFEVIGTRRLTTENVLQEIQWATTTRQPYHLIVIDEAAPKMDSVKVMHNLHKRRLQSSAPAGVIILTSRILAPILRGSGTQVYVLVSKPLITSDVCRSLRLALRELPTEQQSTPTLMRRLPRKNHKQSPSTHVHAVQHSSRANTVQSGTALTDSTHSVLSTPASASALPSCTLPPPPSINNNSTGNVSLPVDPPSPIDRIQTLPVYTYQTANEVDDASTAVTAVSERPPSARASPSTSTADAASRPRSSSFPIPLGRSLHDLMAAASIKDDSTVSTSPTSDGSEHETETSDDERTADLRSKCAAAKRDANLDRTEQDMSDSGSGCSSTTTSPSTTSSATTSPATTSPSFKAVRRLYHRVLPSSQYNSLPAPLFADEKSRKVLQSTSASVMSSSEARQSGDHHSPLNSPVSTTSNDSTSSTSTTSRNDGRISLSSSPPTTPKAVDPGAHVLIVDDNAVNLRVAAKMVSRIGYQPHTCISGETALDFIDAVATKRKPQCAPLTGAVSTALSGKSSGSSSEDDFDDVPLDRLIVLMDVVMKGMSGMECTAELRRRGYTMPIYALTAAATSADEAAAIASGMNGYLTKPLLLTALEKALKQAVSGALENKETAVTTNA